MRRSTLSSALALAVVGVVSVKADTLTLRQGLNGYTGTRDDAARQDIANSYMNLDDGLYAYSTISGEFLGTVVGFDISSIPAGSTINSATLTMSLNESSIFGNGAQQTWQIKNPTAQWIEGQVSYFFAQNTGAGVKWNPTDQPFGSGGTGITMANEPNVIASNSVSGASLAGAAVPFDVTSLVAGWYGGSVENRGFAVLNVSGAPAANMYWAGKANVNETWRPTLTVDYSATVQGWKAQSGDWHDPANWTNGVPNGVDAIANFLNGTTAPRSVFADIATTVGAININNANGFVIGGAGSLTLQTSSGPAAINVLGGSQKINLPLFFASSANISVSSGSTLTIGNPTTIRADKTVTSTGNLLIQAPLTIENGGGLVLASGGVSVFGAPSLQGSARIDVQNSLTIDYRGQSSPAATIRGQLASGYGNGAWNGDGINTSASTSKVGLGWRDDSTSSSIQIQRAYYGDANLSGSVDSTDFSAFVAGYGKTTGGIWAQGDFNYDGKVNSHDFNDLAGNFGQTLAAPALGSAVPEPASLSLLFIGAAGLLRRTQRG
jgi:hypothetical protein